MDLSVVIVSYNSREELGHSIGSVAAAAPGMTCETIVVDNASDDGSADYVSTSLAGVKVIRNEDNRGFGRACNQGFAASTGTHVLFLNPDTRCNAGSLSSLVRLLQDHSGVGAVGPRLLNQDGSLSRSCFRFHTIWRPTLNLPLLRWIVGERMALHYPPQHPSISNGGPVDWISGACLLARREALEQVGGFDEGFFMYFDDTDLCRSLWAAGWHVVYAPAIEVVHHGEKSSRKVWGRMLVEMQRSRLRYLSKHYGTMGRGVVRLLIFLFAALRFAAWTLMGKWGRLRTEGAILRLAVTGP